MRSDFSLSSSACHPGSESTLKPVVTSVNVSPVVQIHFSAPDSRRGIAEKWEVFFSGQATSTAR